MDVDQCSIDVVTINKGFGDVEDIYSEKHAKFLAKRGVV
jgi:hypothetical protein